MNGIEYRREPVDYSKWSADELSRKKEYLEKEIENQKNSKSSNYRKLTDATIHFSRNMALLEAEGIQRNQRDLQ